MRVLAIVSLVLVMLIWHYQYNKNSVQVSTVQTAVVEPTETLHSGEQALLVSIPPLRNTSDWLQPELKSVFDHFLLEYEDRYQAMWLAFADYCAPLIACEQITSLFERYIAYKQALVVIDTQVENTVSAIGEKLSALKQVRHEYFSAVEIEILFGDDAHWQTSALERLAIRQDTNLSEGQKSQLLTQHFQSLDTAEIKSIKPSLQLQQVSELAQANALNNDNYNQLAAEYGPEAADRLIALAKRQKQWQQKLSTYNAKKQKLQQTLTDAELNEAVAALQKQMFSPNELKRIHALSSPPS